MIQVTLCRADIIGTATSFKELADGVFYDEDTGSVVISDGDDAILVEVEIGSALAALPKVIDND